MARSLADRIPRFPGPKDVMDRLPGGLRRRMDSMGAIGKRTWEDVSGSIIRTPRSTRVLRSLRSVGS